jgi:hypothetical protein
MLADLFRSFAGKIRGFYEDQNPESFLVRAIRGVFDPGAE